MTDLTGTIIPKSDQMNSDDLISGPRTIKITRVSADTGSKEQPILIYFDGDDGKPYKPCKSMRRVLVQIWGADGSQFVGRSMTLYRDPTVTWGGMQVGGIRISHMSDIDSQVTMALTATKSSRKPYIVKPLVVASEPKIDMQVIAEYQDKVRKHSEAATDATELGTWWNSPDAKAERKALNIPPDILSSLVAGVTDRIKTLKGTDA